MYHGPHRLCIIAGGPQNKLILSRGVVGWERHSHTFFGVGRFARDYIKTWLRSYRCASDTQIRTACQKSYSETGRSSVEILVGECSLFSKYLVQSSFLFGVGMAFPLLFFSTTLLI